MGRGTWLGSSLMFREFAGKSPAAQLCADRLKSKIRKWKWCSRQEFLLCSRQAEFISIIKARFFICFFFCWRHHCFIFRPTHRVKATKTQRRASKKWSWMSMSRFPLKIMIMRIFVNSKDTLTISLIIMITTMILIPIISSVAASVVTSPQVNASENLMRWPFPLPSSSLSSTSSSLSSIVKVKVKIRWIASVNVMRQPLERNARGFYCSRNHFLERKRFFIQ